MQKETIVMTEDEFIELLKSAVITPSFYLVDSDFIPDESIMIHGVICNNLSIEGMEVSYCGNYSHPIGNPSLVDISYSEIDFEITSNYITVIDEAGHKIEDLEEIITSNTKIENFNKEILGEDEYEKIDDGLDDDDDDSSMEWQYVWRDNDYDIFFKGKILAVAEGSKNYSKEVFSRVLALYLTKGGKYVCQKIESCRDKGYYMRYSGTVCKNKDDIISFFGIDEDSKIIYSKADIRFSVLVG